MKRTYTTHCLWALLLLVGQSNFMAAMSLDEVKDPSSQAEESPKKIDALLITFGNGEGLSLSKELARRSRLLADALSGEPDAQEIPLDKSLCADCTLQELVELLTIDDWETYLNDKGDAYLYRLFLLHRYLDMPDLFEALAQKIGLAITKEASPSGVAANSSSKEESKSVLGHADNVFAQTIAKNIGFIPAAEPMILNTNGAITSVAYSPDGTRIASGSGLGDSSIQLWDTQTGASIGNPLQTQSYVTSVAYSPDGNHIASGSWDRTVRIWDVATEKQIGKPLNGHTNRVMSVASSPDGPSIASGSSDNTVQIGDTLTGALLHTLLGHKGAVHSVVYSPDGTRIASGSDDCTIRIWNAHTGKPVGRPLQGHTKSVFAVAYSPDGRQIASSSSDRTIRIWDAKTGKEKGARLEGHTGPIKSLAYSPDGRQIVSGSHDHTVRIWDSATGKQVGKPLQGHTGLVFSVAYSPDGRQIASGSHDHTVRIWGESYNQRRVQAEQWIKNVLQRNKDNFITQLLSRSVSFPDFAVSAPSKPDNSEKQQNKPYRFKLLGKAKPIAFHDSMIAAAAQAEGREPLAPEDRASLKDLQALVKQTIESRKKADADSSSKESGLADLQEIVISERILYPAEIDYLRSLDKKITEALNQASNISAVNSARDSESASAGGGGTEKNNF